MVSKEMKLLIELFSSALVMSPLKKDGAGGFHLVQESGGNQDMVESLYVIP